MPKHVSVEVVLTKDLVVYLVERYVEMELGCVDGCCDVTAMDVVEEVMISTDESEVRTELDEALENVEKRNCVVNGKELDVVYMEEDVAVVT